LNRRDEAITSRVTVPIRGLSCHVHGAIGRAQALRCTAGWTSRRRSSFLVDALAGDWHVLPDLARIRSVRTPQDGYWFPRLRVPIWIRWRATLAPGDARNRHRRP
jgi:hypothetical protein